MKSSHTLGAGRTAVLYALLAAALYALNAPASKLLLSQIPETMLAALLYLGAGLGVALLRLCARRGRPSRAEERFSRADLPFVIGMIVLDVAAPILLMLGLRRTTAANVSLLNSFEIVATSLIALAFFHERIPGRLWAAIGLVTLASALLSFEGENSLRFSVGSLYVLLACVCWGLENNCTRRLSGRSPLAIVIVKGCASGAISLSIALSLGERLPSAGFIALSLLLGFVAYGLSITCYVYAQRTLGAAKTSACYAVAPFVGVLLSLVLLAESPSVTFWPALALMIGGVYLASTDGQRAVKEE